MQNCLESKRERERLRNFFRGEMGRWYSRCSCDPNDAVTLTLTLSVLVSGATGSSLSLSWATRCPAMGVPGPLGAQGHRPSR